MNFEVNGQAYVLTYLPGEGSFALFETDEDGAKRMKIVHDDGPMLIAKIGDDQAPEGKPSLN
jgi:hypothetical protein